MTTNAPPSCAIVLLADHAAALCTIDRVQPAHWLTNLPTRHPDRVLVETKCLVARSYLVGDVDGPYDDHDCEAAARLLIDEEMPPPPPARRPRRRRRPLYAEGPSCACSPASFSACCVGRSSVCSAS